MSEEELTNLAHAIVALPDEERHKLIAGILTGEMVMAMCSAFTLDAEEGQREFFLVCASESDYVNELKEATKAFRERI